MDFKAEDLRSALARLLLAMPDLEKELNAADSRLGDGDTGGMLARVIRRMAETPIDQADLGKAFSALAQAAAVATGSSLGTLFATGLLACARQAKGRDAVSFSELGEMLASARDAMLKRGQSNLGDKTVIDAIDAVAVAVGGKTDRASTGMAAVEGARDVLDRFRNRPCRIGRARMFGDESRGLDDPGMLAFVRLVEAITAQGLPDGLRSH